MQARRDLRLGQRRRPRPAAPVNFACAVAASGATHQTSQRSQVDHRHRLVDAALAAAAEQPQHVAGVALQALAQHLRAGAVIDADDQECRGAYPMPAWLSLIRQQGDSISVSSGTSRCSPLSRSRTAATFLASSSSPRMTATRAFELVGALHALAHIAAIAEIDGRPARRRSVGEDQRLRAPRRRRSARGRSAGAPPARPRAASCSARCRWPSRRPASPARP